MPANAAAAQPIGDPQRIVVPKIEVDAGFEPLAIGPGGLLAAPEGLHNVGWAVGAPEPGEVGTSVVAGHFDTKTGPAVFYRLAELAPGDEVIVSGASGSASFVVERVEHYAKTDLPDDVYAPTDGASLRLITCGGDFDRSSGHYVDNVVVFATLAA